MKILVLFSDSRRDVVYFLPHLKNFLSNFKNEKLYALCSSRAKEFLLGEGFLNIFSYEDFKGPFKAVDFVQKEKFDAALGLFSPPEWEKILRMSGIKKIWGEFEKPKNPIFESYNRILENAEIKISPFKVEKLWDDYDETVVKETVLKKLKRPITTINISPYHESERWFLKFYAETIQSLVKMKAGVAIVGNEEHKKAGIELAKLINSENVVNLTGTLSGKQIAFLISLSECVLSPNSFVVPLAWILKKPQLILSGPFPWQIFAPPDGKYKILEGRCPLGYCYGKCTYSEKRWCMKQIEPQKVALYLKQMLK